MLGLLPTLYLVFEAEPDGKLPRGARVRRLRWKRQRRLRWGTGLDSLWLE